MKMMETELCSSISDVSSLEGSSPPLYTLPCPRWYAGPLSTLCSIAAGYSNCRLSGEIAPESPDKCRNYNISFI